jgi:hypothetical protein
MWRQIYESPWNDPVSFIAVNVAVLAAVLLSKSAMRAFLLVFVAEILLDATLTFKGAPIPPALGPYIGIPFVILGDARAIILLERVRRVRSPSEFVSRDPLRPTLVAIAMAFAVPVMQAILLQVLPSVFADRRRLFLAYELLFLCAWSVYFAAFVRPALALAERSLARWARVIFAFVAVQYTLWSTADIVILSGYDAGYGLRLVPSAMYYAVFLPLVWRSAPREVRAS